MARECQLYPDRVVVKYGFAGRVLLGPKGHPGDGDAARSASTSPMPTTRCWPTMR